MSTAGELSGKNGPRKYKTGDEDFFIDPPWCTVALLEHEKFDGLCWDPCCGSGTIPDVLAANDIACMGTDIVDRGDLCQWITANFLTAYPPPDLRCIIMNPPYGLAERFIRRALVLAPKVCALVQSKFPYSQHRYHLFTFKPPAKIYFLSSRPSMPPGEAFLRGEIKRGGGKLDYCWVVWERGRKPEAPGWLMRRK